MPSTEITFLLAGKAGVGKSALGNTILGEYMFESTNSDSVTKEISMKSKERKDFLFTVVDTPGLIDTKLGIDEANIKACKDMKKAMQICPRNGKLAVIFVIKYGERHTEDNKNTLHILETIFGKKNIWKSSLIVMTHGENYDLDHENKFFYDYLKEQKGDFGEIFANCNYKCVLFHNKTKIKEQQEKELQMLINGANSLEQGFTHSKFEEAYKEQNRLELESFLPKLKAKFEMDVSRLNSSLREIKLNLESSDALDKLEYEVCENLDHVEMEDPPTKIYYRKDEPRLLEDIRVSFNKILELIFIKKVELRQMKVAHEINNEVEHMKKEIIQTDPTDKEISILLQSLTEKLLKITKLMENPDLRNEDKAKIKLNIDSTELELEKLKMKADNLEEYYLNVKKDNLIRRLNNVDISDVEANELLLNLKYETETFKSSLKNAVKSLKTIQCGIRDKIESVRQFKIEYSLKLQKEHFIKELDEAYAKRDGDYKFVCDIIERLTNLKESLKTEVRNKDTTDRLKL